MAEKRVEVRTFETRLYCEHCGEEMLFLNRDDAGLGFWHGCINGHTERVIRTFPRIEHEEIQQPKDCGILPIGGVPAPEYDTIVRVAEAEQAKSERAEIRRNAVRARAIDEMCELVRSCAAQYSYLFLNAKCQETFVDYIDEFAARLKGEK